MFVFVFFSESFDKDQDYNIIDIYCDILLKIYKDRLVLYILVIWTFRTKSVKFGSISKYLSKWLRPQCFKKGVQTGASSHL